MTCEFNPTAIYICAFCRGGFSSLELLNSHQSKCHKDKCDIVKFVVFEELFFDNEPKQIFKFEPGEFLPSVQVDKRTVTVTPRSSIGSRNDGSNQQLNQKTKPSSSVSKSISSFQSSPRLNFTPDSVSNSNLVSHSKSNSFISTSHCTSSSNSSSPLNLVLNSTSSTASTSSATSFHTETIPIVGKYQTVTSTIVKSSTQNTKRIRYQAEFQKKTETITKKQKLVHQNTSQPESSSAPNLHQNQKTKATANFEQKEFYKCSFCKDSFGIQRHRDEHEKTHSHKMSHKYKCEVKSCTSAFSTNSKAKLNSHKSMEHSQELGLALFPCPAGSKCGKVFAYESYLKMHMTHCIICKGMKLQE